MLTIITIIVITLAINTINQSIKRARERKDALIKTQESITSDPSPPPVPR